MPPLLLPPAPGPSGALRRALAVLSLVCVGLTALLLSTPATAQSQPALSFSDTAYTIQEEDGQVIITVEASPAPSADLSVNVQASDGTATEGDRNDYMGTTWRVDFPVGVTTASFIIPIVKDTVLEGSETFTLRLVARPGEGYTIGTPGTATITIVDTIVIDSDTGTSGVQFTSLPVTEGSMAEYTVVLPGAPMNPVMVAVQETSAAISLSGLTSGALTFSTSNWATAQTVTVTAVEDNDNAVNEEAVISHTTTSMDSNFNNIALDLPVSVMDNDTPTLVFTEVTWVIQEGETLRIPIAISPPLLTASSVEVAVSGDATLATDYTLTADGATISSSPFTLLLDANADRATINITAIADMLTESDNEPVVLTLSAISSPPYKLGNPGATEIVVLDSSRTPEPGIDITPSTLTALDEATGNSAEYTLRLRTQPSTNAVIAVAADDSDAVSINPASLTFTSSNWSTVQTVTVTAVQDDDADSETVTLSHTPSGDTTYAALTLSTATVEVSDDDTPALSFSEASTSTSEDFASVVVTVNIDPPLPTADSTVNVVVDSSSTATGADHTTPATLSLTAGESTAKLTVMITDDDIIERAETLVLRLEAINDAPYTVDSTATHTITILEVSTATVSFAGRARNFMYTSMGMTVDSGIGEHIVTEGDSYQLPVILDRPTVSDIPFTISVRATGISGFSDTDTTATEGTDFTFETMGAIPAGERRTTISIRALLDDVVDPDERFWLIMNINSMGLRIEVGPDPTVVTIAEEAGVAVTPATLAALDEATGNSAEYTLRLRTPPSTDAVIAVAADDSDAVSINPTSLTFTSSNWSTVQTVTVTAVQDDDADSETVTLSHTPSGDTTYAALTLSTATVEVSDDDTPALSFSEASTSTSEDFASVVVTVNIDPPLPTADSTVNVVVDSSSTAADADHTTPATLSLEDGESTAKLTVMITDDDVVELSETLVLRLEAISPAPYTVDSTATHTITILSDDVGSISFTGSLRNFMYTNMDGMTVDSGIGEHIVTEGDSYQLTLTLDRTAVSDIPFTISVRATGISGFSDTDTTATEGTDFILETMGAIPAGELRSTISIQALLDDVVDPDERFWLGMSIRDMGLSIEVSPDPTVVTITEEAGVAVTPATLTALDEATGNSAEYTLRLRTPPSADVVVAVAADDSDAVSINPASLTFTSSNWSTVQTVTVTATEDDDGDSETVTLSHSPSGDTTYASLTLPTATVEVSDDDANKTFSLAGDTILEGLDAGLTITLGQGAPAGGLAFSVTSNLATSTSATAADVGTVPATITVPPGQRTATLTIPTIADGTSEGATPETFTVTIATTVSGWRPQAADAETATVSIEDADSPGVTIDTNPATAALETSLSLNEGTMAEYTIVLRTTPTADVTIAITNPDTTGAVTVSPNSLTFTTSNGTTVQTVTVTAPQDAGANSETVTLSHAATGATEYASLSLASVVVTVNDDDGAGIVISPEPTTPLSITGGGTETYTLALRAQPSAPVTVAVASDTPGVATVAPGSLSFSTSDWMTAQTVVVTGVSAGMASIGHTASGATEYEGLSLASVRVTVTAAPVVAPPTAANLDNEVNEALMPQLSRALVDSTVGAVARRIDRGAGDPTAGGATAALGGQSSLSALVQRYAPALAEGQLTLSSLLDGSGFALPLQQHAARSDDAPLWLSTLTLWGSGEYRNLSDRSGGSDDALDWRGEVSTAQLGVDARLHNDWLLGVAGAWSRGTMDYRHADSADTRRRDYQLTLGSVLPYLSWTPKGGEMQLWLSGGYGLGELRRELLNDERVQSDLNQRLVAGGASLRLLQQGSTSLRLNVQGQGTWTEVDGNRQKGLARLRVQSSALRATLQGQRTVQLRGGASLTPNLELGIRHDGGDGDTGTGAQLGGALRYHNAQGLQADAGGEVLLGRGEYREWGVWGLVSWTTSTDGRGWSLQLQPRYGMGSRGTGTTLSPVDNTQWLQGGPPLNTLATPAPASGQLDLRLGYGLARGGGLLAPYSELSLGAETRRWRMGLQWLLGQWQVDLVGERIEQRTATASSPGTGRNHSILLEGRIQY